VYRFDGSVGQAGIGEQACRGSEVAAVHSCGPGKGVHGLAWTISTLQDSDESPTVERVEQSECEERCWARPVNCLVPALACDCGQAESCALVKCSNGRFQDRTRKASGCTPLSEAFLQLCSWQVVGGRESKSGSWRCSSKRSIKTRSTFGVPRCFLSQPFCQSLPQRGCDCSPSRALLSCVLCASRQRPDLLASTCSAQNLDWSLRSGLLPSAHHFTLCFTLQLPI